MRYSCTHAFSSKRGALFVLGAASFSSEEVVTAGLLRHHSISEGSLFLADDSQLLGSLLARYVGLVTHDHHGLVGRARLNHLALLVRSANDVVLGRESRRGRTDEDCDGQGVLDHWVLHNWLTSIQKRHRRACVPTALHNAARTWLPRRPIGIRNAFIALIRGPDKKMGRRSGPV
jgi:hypothetical protein